MRPVLYALNEAEDPTTFEYALTDVYNYQLKKSVKKELKELEVNNIQTEVDVTADKDLLQSKWVFRAKKMNRSMHLNKARLVTKGFQKEDTLNNSEFYMHLSQR